MARSQGPFGTQWIPIKRSDIITGNTLGPTIKIDSRSISEAKKLREFQQVQGLVQMMAADPRVNMDVSYTYRKMGRLIMPKQEIERMIPLSQDEQTALDENDQLDTAVSAKDLPRVTVNQDHNVHLRVHASAKDTPATRRHIELHRHMIMEKRSNPSAFPQLPGETAPGQQGANGSVATPGTQMTPSTPQLMNPAQKIKAPATPMQ